MKPLTIITSLLILVSSVAFANKPCTDCGSMSFFTETEVTGMTLDNLQQESQQTNLVPSSGLTGMVMHKLNALKAEGNSTSDLFDRLQKETEEISIAQPILILASAIEKKFNKQHVKNSNVSAGLDRK